VRLGWRSGSTAGPSSGGANFGRGGGDVGKGDLARLFIGRRRGISEED